MNKELKIIYNTDPHRLQQEIQKSLDNGFELYGNLVVTFDTTSNNVWHYQEMIKNGT